MRLVHLLSLTGVVGVSPAYAATGGLGPSAAIGAPSSAFAAPHMNDGELAGIVGTGGGPGFRFFRDASAVNARLVEQQNGIVLVTTFDNWFTDVGAPLIFANIAGSR